jgi:hypothetical protein
VNAL